MIIKLFFILFVISIFLLFNYSLFLLKGSTKNTIREYFLKNNEIVYLFWTGGYDSTFRLCQLSIIEKRIIQPIYLIGAELDNNKNSTKNKRKNVKEELNSMKIIRKKIFEKFPDCKKYILPLKIFNNIELSPLVKKNMMELYHKNFISRPTTQYGTLAQVTINLNKKVELCSERHSKSIMCNLIFGKDYCSKKSNKKKIINCPKIFKNFVFPIGNYTKEDMLEESKKYNFNDILFLTWSCWYPIDGKPCKKCPMCLERII